MRPQRGTYVRKIDVSEVEVSRFVREAVEADIARLAAQGADAADVAELRRQVAEQAEAARDGGRSFVQLDELFHRTLAKIAGRAGAWAHLQPIKMHMDRVRHLTAAEIPEAVDIVVCDASFIGLETVLPTPLGFARAGAWLVALIKPQFEAGREQVGKGGVVRDPAVHEAVCAGIRDWLDGTGQWRVDGLTRSPITGPEGNVEFLIAATRLC